MREMLIRINDNAPSIAITQDRQLSEMFLPSPDRQNLVGNIYLGKVENVLPGMQAAFINIGLEKNSFLYVEDAENPKEAEAALTDCEAKKEKRCSISDLVKPDQHVMVQVFKEPLGSKGARVTMQPSLPGRYTVLLPLGNYVAVSRRIEDESERERLKVMVRDQLPPYMGAIVRTAASAAAPEAVRDDLRLLVKQWQQILERSAQAIPPALIHRDLDLLKKVIRDTGDADIDRIVAGNEVDFGVVAALCDQLAPSLRPKLVLRESADIFFDYDIYNQMERALRRKVWLKSGGYIIIDQTEALTVIDVNTGKYVGENNLADTVMRTNLEAVTEIARQLRLRNIGGIIIIDFIDIYDSEDKKKLLEELNKEVEADRVRTTVMGMTQLGLVELTRKKVGRSLSSVMEKTCPYCSGKGRVPYRFFDHGQSL